MQRLTDRTVIDFSPGRGGSQISCHRLKVVLFAGAVALAASWLGLFLFASREGVLTPANFRRINVGMHLSEVERLLGGRGDGPRERLREVCGQDMLNWDNPNEKYWMEWRVGDQEVSFCVIFDAGDRVVRKVDRSMPPEGVLDWLQDLLRLVH